MENQGDKATTTKKTSSTTQINKGRAAMILQQFYYLQTLSTSQINKSAEITLDKNNYLAWKSDITNLLVRAGSFFMIDGSYDPSTGTATIEDEEGATTSFKDPVLPLLDQQITILILERMTEEIYASIPFDSFASSRSLWIALEEKFATQSKDFLMQLRSQFRSMRQDTPSITKYLQRVDEIVDGLEASGKKIPKEDLVIEVLAGLGPEYEFEHADNKLYKVYSFDQVTEVLLDQKTELDAKTLFHYQPIFSPNIGN